MDKRLDRRIDENLRDVPLDPVGLKQYVVELEQALQFSESKKQVSILGEMGVHLRSLGELTKARKSILKALEIVKQNHLGIKWEVQQKIRLAHVLQWEGSYEQSTALFEEIISTCRTHAEAGVYLDFALQHAGKNFFEQKMFRQALSSFEEAMAIRVNREAPKDQIESTQVAIDRTRKLMK